MSLNLIRLNAVDDCGWSLSAGEPKRDTFIGHAYRCDPLIAANKSCLDIVLDHDIELDWNGGREENDLQVISGRAKSHFGMGTITLEQGYIWKTTDSSWLLIGGQPNPEQTHWRMMDALISPNDLHYPWFPSIKFFRPGIHKIGAGTVIGSVRSVVAGIDSPSCQFSNVHESLRQRQSNLADQRDQGKRKQVWFYRKSTRRRLSLTQHGKFSNVLVGKGWLDRKTCDRLMSDFEHNCFDWSVADVWRFDHENYLELSEAISDAGLAIERLIGIPLRRVNVNGVRWKPGDAMPMHTDYGAENEFPNRHWTTIINLNEAKGGNLLLPEMEVSSATGQMISLPGGMMQHGVSEVLETRYTIVLWWEVYIMLSEI